jgi:ABC-2 type transport system permease protein
MTSGLERNQLSAIARLRWQLFVNSLHTIRGRLEMVSRAILMLTFVAGGLAGGIGLGLAAYFLMVRGETEWLAILFWVVFIFWQISPVVASAFTDNLDTSSLLRFPLAFSSYFLVRIAYGMLDPSTLICGLWVTGIATGITMAAPALCPLVVLICLVFAALNILFAQMIFAWLERWLATRRTREIMGILFFFFVIGIQFLAPAERHFIHGGHVTFGPLILSVLPIERLLPPGLAAAAIENAAGSNLAGAAGSLALLSAFALLFFWLLQIRLRKQFRGESFSEEPARSSAAKQRASVPAGFDFEVFSGPVTAILEKEFHYLSRSGPMLFSFVMPVVVLLLLRFSGPGTGHGGENFLVKAPDLAFPIAAAYSLLILTNLVYNSFGADGMGIQFFFLAPVRLREVVLAKNLAHSVVLALVTFFVWLVVCLMFRPPSLSITIATISGILFALPINLAAGDLLSVYSPKKMDTAILGRQRLPTLTVFASLGVQIIVIGLASLNLLLARHFGEVWIATLVFLALAGVTFVTYSLVLRRIDTIVLDRREVLIHELSRAS